MRVFGFGVSRAKGGGRAMDGGKEELLVEVQTTALSLLFGQIGRYVVCVEWLVGYNLN